MLRKNLSILWALTESGIVLQELSGNSFFELDQMQEKIWAYADGTHTENDIVLKLMQEYPNIPEKDLRQTLKETLDFLLENELLQNHVRC